MEVLPNRAATALNLRHSIAPRVVDNTVAMGTLVSTSRFSVRVAQPSSNAPPSPTASILTTFVWRDSGARVLLAGSFDDWRKHSMTFVPGVGYHILVTELPPGEYMYRFVVDGRWRIAENDPNLKEDTFGELSHHLVISHQAAASAVPKRFSSAVVAHAEPSADVALDRGDSDTESEASEESVPDAPDAPDIPLPPRRKGDANFVEDYDDDACGELDLQADVFEAIKDVAESTGEVPAQDTTFSQSSHTDRRKPKIFRPRGKVLRRVWGVLFGDLPDEENIDPAEERSDARPTHNQKVHGLANNENALKKGLKVWFPNERNFPSKNTGRKVAPAETREVIDAGDRALKFHQVEDNANTRQLLGKTLFAQGKYDAALALFSLSVKLREDNGLKYAKTTAIAHTDVASAFIYLEDLKNAEKHLNMALAIYQKGTFSGGRSQLGDVHCFLGVIGDMKSDLRAGELSYRAAIELYKQAKATDNPNYATAVENLDANVLRQKQVQQRAPPTKAVEASLKRRNAERELSVVSSSKPPRRTKPLVPQAPAPCSPPAPRKQPPSKPLDVSRPAPRIHDDELSGHNHGGAYGNRSPLEERQKVTPPKPPNGQSRRPGSRRNPNPKSWKDLADTARASMPHSPPIEDLSDSDEVEPPAGSYEEMSLGWHKEARQLLAKGEYKEAMDLYTLAIYTRKRHGPWATRENSDTLVEYARALFATKNLEESVKVLKDAISILEQNGKKKDELFLGEVWGNLGSVLDRIGGHHKEALTAHIGGMVVYGRGGMSMEDAKWLKAWKSLCINLKMSGSSDRTDEIWKTIDLQIRGVTPMTKVGAVNVRE